MGRNPLMITSRTHIFYVATTRFNSTTWKENESYRDKCSFDGCLYGTPLRIAQPIPPDSIMFILEMLNIQKGHPHAPGKIMGIGLIRNRPNYRKYRSIVFIRMYVSNMGLCRFDV